MKNKIFGIIGYLKFMGLEVLIKKLVGVDLI